MATDDNSTDGDKLWLNFDPGFYIGQGSLGKLVDAAVEDYMKNIDKAIEPFVRDILRGVTARIDFDDAGGSFLYIANHDIDWATKFDLAAFLKEQHKDDPEFFTNLRGLLRSIDEERLGPP